MWSLSQEREGGKKEETLFLAEKDRYHSEKEKERDMIGKKKERWFLSGKKIYPAPQAKRTAQSTKAKSGKGKAREERTLTNQISEKKIKRKGGKVFI